MNSYISSFKWLILAVMAFLFIEGSYYLTFKPKFEDRTNFVPANVQNWYTVSAQRYIIWDKIRTDYNIAPTYVQVGDSSGYFGINPEVVERYLDGEKYLNWSCCGNQGWHGYLAMLELALKKYETLKGIVIHAGMLDVPPSKAQWHGGGRRSGTNQVSFSVMGKEMIRDLNSIWTIFALPTLERRLQVLQLIFQKSIVSKDAFFTTNTHLIGQLTEQRLNQGHALETDFQKLPVQSYLNGCQIPVNRFWGWTAWRERSYLDAAMDEFVRLANKYDVKPMIAFQATPCDGLGGAEEMKMEIEKVKRLYPDLIVLTDLTEDRSPVSFSTGVHLQRGFAEDASRRLGERLRRVENGFPPYPKTSKSRYLSQVILIW